MSSENYVMLTGLGDAMIQNTLRNLILALILIHTDMITRNQFRDYVISNNFRD